VLADVAIAAAAANTTAGTGRRGYDFFSVRTLGLQDISLIRLPLLILFSFYLGLYVISKRPLILSPRRRRYGYFTARLHHRGQRAKGMFPMASSSSSSPPHLLILLRALPSKPLLLSRHRKPFPYPKSGRIAVAGAVGAQQRLLFLPDTGRWRRGGGFPCFSYNANNESPPSSDKVMLSRFHFLITC
jgi:hypothetical protein